MPEDVQWIAARIVKCREGNDLVTDAVSVRMQKLLSDDLSEQPLSPAKLTSIAKLLVADMVPVSSCAEVKK
jgi:hypothetical protein